MNSNDAVNALNSGIVPECLNFRDDRDKTFDLELLKYNTFYKSKDYILGKLPNGTYDHIPGFDQIVEQMADNMKSPLEELQIKKNLNEYNDEISSSENDTISEDGYSTN